MKKTILIIFLLLLLLHFNTKNVEPVIEYEEKEDNIYEIDFTNEILSTSNFKLKIASFTGYSYVIRKLYPKYNSNLKHYYTYDFRNIDEGIEKFRLDYINKLRESNLYDEIDKVYKNGVIIKKIEIFSNKYAIRKLIKKYPKVKYKIISDANYL